MTSPLENLRALSERATPGPWLVENADDPGRNRYGVTVYEIGSDEARTSHMAEAYRLEMAALIVAAVNFVCEGLPTLLRERGELEARIAELEAQLTAAQERVGALEAQLTERTDR